jgi:hypothetical protein
LKGLIIVQTMMSPFKIIKCCLYNDEFLQDHQMLFAQWWVPSRSSNAVCTNCADSIWWSWRDSSLYKQHLFILKGLFIVQTTFVDLEGTTMMSPFKINKCCLYNEKSLQDKQMLFVQWRVPSRSTNVVCTMKSPSKINKCDLEGTHHCANSIWWSWRDSSLCKQHLMILKGPFIVQQHLMILKGLIIVQIAGQWRVPSRSSNAICTMMSPFKIIKSLSNNIWWSWRDSSLYKQHLMILKGLFIVQTTFVYLEGTHHCTNNMCLSW